MKTLFEKLALCQTPGEVERMLAGNGFGDKIFDEIIERMPWVRIEAPTFRTEIEIALSDGIDAALKAGKD